MTGYDVYVEAQCYDNPDAAAEALLGALQEIGALDELKAAVHVDEGRAMLMTVLKLQATDGLDAHTAGLETWSEAWQNAFPDAPGTERFSIKCVPAGVPARAASQNGTRP